MQKLKILILILFIFDLSLNSQNLIWANNISGDSGNSVSTDTEENVYILGTYSNSSLGSTTTPAQGSKDIFIKKLDLGGNLLWVKTIGGVNWDEGYSMDIDNNNSLYITGRFSGSVDFDPGPNNFNLVSNSNSDDVFILKLDYDGEFEWAKKIGGNLNDYGRSIKVDNAGNVILTGSFTGTVDFNPNSGTYDLTTQGADNYILKLDALGNFLWAVKSNLIYSTPYSLVLSDNGNIYITGIQSLSLFVQKFTSLGSNVWVKKIPQASGRDIIIDNNENLYITGRHSGTVDFDPSTGIEEHTSIDGGIFILKMDLNGSFVWVKTVGGNGDDEGVSLTKGLNNEIYITGSYVGTVDFDPGVATYNLTNINSNVTGIFILKLDYDGEFISANSINTVGSGGDGLKLKYDQNNNLYLVGQFAGIGDFNPFVGETILTAGDLDGFILKISCNEYVNINKLICEGDSLYFNKQYISIPGKYIERKPISETCDSVLILDLGFKECITDIPFEKKTENNLFFPNPTQKTLNIKSTSIKKIEIINTNGKIVLVSNEHTINIENLTSGIYFAKCYDLENKFIETSKIEIK